MRPRCRGDGCCGLILTTDPQTRPTATPQALLVSNELNRVAILWGELWHESLEQSYRRYFYYEQQARVFRASDGPRSSGCARIP